MAVVPPPPPLRKIQKDGSTKVIFPVSINGIFSYENEYWVKKFIVFPRKCARSNRWLYLEYAWYGYYNDTIRCIWLSNEEYVWKVLKSE